MSKKTLSKKTTANTEMAVAVSPLGGGGGGSIIAEAAGKRAAMTPQDRIKENAELVQTLAPEIQREHLADIQGKPFMCVGGGIAIANAMGYAISVGPVSFDKDQGVYFAEASMTNGITDDVVASAVGYVGDDEPRWMEGPKAARNSMVQTRAEAKLCRINFGHLYTLLGACSATPAEEMSMVQQPVQYRAQPTAQPAKRVVPAASRNTGAGARGVGVTHDSDGGTHVMTLTKVEPATKRDGSVMQGTKKNGEPWMKMRVTNSDNEWFDTFNNSGEADIAEDAIKNHGGIATVTWERSQWGKNIVDDGVIPGEGQAEAIVETEPVVEEEIPF